MNEAIDFNTLKWLKQELDQTLTQARQALEAHVEEGGEGEPLKECAEHLHQVTGTLKMVQLYGAVLLAEEMEGLVGSLIGQNVAQTDAAHEILMRALLQLPDYLERLIRGHRDIPLVLLPLLNDMRAVRGENLLSENTLFQPDLASPLPESVRNCEEPDTDIVMLARTQRHKFQLALLGWFRNQESDESLRDMLEVVDLLQRASRFETVSRLWWVGGGVLHALATKQLESSMATRLLLGQIDRQIKTLIESGEESLAAAPAVDLYKNLLFYVGRASSGDERIDEIKQVYTLENILPAEDEIEEARQSLQGHNAELMETVSAAIKEDIAKVKDALDLFIRNSDKAPAELSGSAEILRRVGETLGMLGMGSLRQAMQGHAELVGKMAGGEQDIEEAGLMDVASALLFVESSLDGLSNAGAPHPGSAKGPDIASNELGLPEAELGQVKGIVAEEALRDLALAKEAISVYATAQDEFGPLENVPQLFNQIKGGLLLLNETRAAGLVDSVASYIAVDLLEKQSSPEGGTLDWLADAISSVEYYLENLCESRVLSGSVLDVAEASVERLGYPTEPVDETAQADVAIANAAETDEANEPEDSATFEDIADTEQLESEAGLDDSTGASEDVIQFEPMETLEGVAEEETVKPAVVSTAADHVPSLEIVATEPELASGEPESQAADTGKGTDIGAGAVETRHAVLEGEPDEEILEIFLEEAEEELASITENLHKWIENADDKDSLGNVRRSFHTIKGSGRIVGATRIGEFAWAFENILNRLTDGTLARSDALCSLLQQTVNVLPQLVEEIRAGAPSARAEGLMDSADAASRGEELTVSGGTPQEEIREEIHDAGPAEEPPVEEPTPDVVADAGSESDAVAAGQDEAENDDILLEIFVTEAQEHIVTLHACLDPEAGESGIAVSEELRRALHTLHGSAYMANIQPIAEIAEAADKYVREVAANEVTIQAEAREMLLAATAMVETLVDRIYSPQSDWPDNTNILERIAVLPVSPIVSESDAGPIVEFAPELPVNAPVDISIQVESSTLEVAEETVEDVAEEAPPSVVATVYDEYVEVAPVTDHEAVDYAELDDELVDVFLEEGSEILESLEQSLHIWVQAPDDAEVTAAVQRDLHTMKGGARMASLMTLGNLCHGVETMIESTVDGRVVAGPALFELLHTAQDHLTEMVEAVRQRAAISSPQAILNRIDALLSVPVAEEQAAQQDEDTSAIEPVAVAEQAMPPELPEAVDPEASDESVKADVPAKKEERRKANRAPQELVRIRADLLDDMVNFAGEISIYRSRLEQQVGSFRFNLVELDQTVDRLREQLRKLEIETEAQVLFRYEREETSGDSQFDPLEMDRYSHIQQLSRSLAESIGDLMSIQGLLDNVNRESETLLLQQSRVNTELHEGLMRTRMVPFSGLAPRMRRIVRQVCKELGKQADLVLEGAEGEMDRTVIDRVIAPIEHMLRNAIAHGIESPDERKEAGKKESGTIIIKLAREGSEVVIRITDDGRGMNLQAIRAKARDRGLITDDKELSDNDVMQFVLETGFSTAEKVTQISGRGVGMDVVNSEIKQLGGTLHIGSKEGQGTEFTVRLPFTLSITQALMVQVHEEVFAIPLSSIEGIVRMNAEDIQRYYADSNLRYEYADTSYEVQYLGSVLGHGTPIALDTSERLPVLLVRAGDQRVALQVDALLGSRETVVKSVGAQISTVRGVSGATILGDGRVVLILDPAAMLRRAAAADITGRELADISEPDTVRAITVMVVDDSITVRKVTTRLLERSDYSVVTAKDGVDAVAMLQEIKPDVMLLDIEMPRMDGYELATHVRNDQRLRDVPIVMITSRTGDKHRNRAMEIGVDEYLGKPFQESDLLSTITELLQARQADGTRGAS